MIKFSSDLETRINQASAEGVPIVAASVDADGQPQLAHYGTLQVFQTDKLGFWVRRPEHLLERLATNPRMSFIYWNRAERLLLKMIGIARVTGDESDRETIFVNSPKDEQAADPERNGTAFVVDLHSVSGFAAGEALTMAND
jgi:hypothetical protein